MNINRNNYEEFFLLYIDNELSAAERNAVELFVQENEDLKEELNMLQQTVYKADAVVFDKTSLLKEEMTALQQNLLLYIDDELSAADKFSFEKLLNADSASTKELTLLQQTKLQPDTTIVFANKKLLYKKDRAKVIILPWRKIAAAAILLGFGTWATVKFINTNKKTGENVVTNTNKKSTSPTQNTLPAVAPPQQKTTDESNVTAVNTANTSPTKEPAQNNNQVYKTNPPLQKKEDIIVANENNKKPNNNLPQPVYEIINIQESNINDVATVTPTDKATDKINPRNNNTDAASNKIIINEANNTYALNTNFTESNAEEKNDNQILYMNEDKVKKTKLGGLFRKVKRLVERNTNVQTGNSIKLAGFDIAIK